MTAILDTHVFIWLDTDARRLSATAVGYLTDPKCKLVLSAASVWEMAIKNQLGKLRSSDTLENVVAQQVAVNSIHLLPITAAHGMAAGSLPLLHRDPFDRMLVAQTNAEDATLLTDDPLVRLYAVRTDW